MSKHGFASEADLAKIVLAWLEAEGWMTYQEVEHRGDIADIVATRGEQVAVVECKLALNLDVLHQGNRWLHRAHLTWIAVPLYGARGRDTDAIARVICSKLGLGMLTVTAAPERVGGFAAKPTRVYERVAPELRTPEPSKRPLLDVLRPEHQTFAEAGSPTGSRWTDFKATGKALGEIAAAEPGVDLRAALKRVKHHWRTKDPTGVCAKRIRQGFLPGLRVEMDTSKPRGAQLRLYIASVDGNADCGPPAQAHQEAEIELASGDGNADCEPAAVPPEPPVAPPASSTATSSPTTSRSRHRSRAWRSTP